MFRNDPADTEEAATLPPLEEPTLSEEGGIRYLHFDSAWIQGAMRMARPSELVLAYTQQMMAWLLFLEPLPAHRIGILGLGAGSLLRFTLRHTRSSVDTVERNPRVTALCHACFRLPTPARSQIVHADASAWVADPRHHGRYRALMVDLYDGEAQGPVCSDLAFYRHCRQVLACPGILTVNLFGHHASFDYNLGNLDEAFEGRIVSLPELDEGNTVVLAASAPLAVPDPATLLDRARALQARTGLPAVRLARSLSRRKLSRWLR